MDIELLDLGGCAVLKPSDELDLLGYQHLGEKIDEVAREGMKKIILDCESVSYLNSSTARMLQSLSEKSTEDGLSLAVARPTAGVMAILQASGAAQKLKIFNSLDEAMTAFGVA